MIYWKIIIYCVLANSALLVLFALVSYDVFEGLNRLIVHGRKPKRRKL